MFARAWIVWKIGVKWPRRRPAAAGLFALSILSAVLLATRVALPEAQGATEAPLPPRRTSLSDPGVRYTVPVKGYVVLRRGEIEAVIADNRAVDDEVLP